MYLTLLPDVEYMLTNVAEPHADATEFLVDPGRTNPEGRGKFVSFAALPEGRDGTDITEKDSEYTRKKPPPDPNPKPLGTIDTSGIRKIYRPKLPSRYKDVDLGADELEGLDVLFRDYGQTLYQKANDLDPRDDIIQFDEGLHSAELKRNLKWHRCPEVHRSAILEIVKEYWDVFCKEGLRRNIRGFSCRIDTGNAEPICCRVPRYGPHESRVITKLVDQLEKNSLVEDDGPWGAQVVLAASRTKRTCHGTSTYGDFASHIASSTKSPGRSRTRSRAATKRF